MGFREDQIRRYSRHLLLKEVGGTGQRRLLDASVLVVGAGGLGCPAALYLAAAGVGTVALADPDAVELSNLQRQVLYGPDDVGKPKVEAAAAVLRRLNPDVRIETFPIALGAGNAAALLRGRTLVLEGTDSPGTKFLVNDLCVAAGIPLVIGGVVRWNGQVAVVAGGSGCYRCLFESPPEEGTFETCEGEGVLGPAAGAVGTLMAVEGCKRLLGLDSAAPGRLQVLDLLAGTTRQVRWTPRPGCAACAAAPGHR
ncbi:MAG: HesA/MoeB/ThiF family protein [Candidatus Brocadiae bacterium]|nr:HesA/MoeB/ThiF family protein [Candidatus Brocadiia bacterium]